MIKKLIILYISFVTLPSFTMQMRLTAKDDLIPFMGTIVAYASNDEQLNTHFTLNDNKKTFYGYVHPAVTQRVPGEEDYYSLSRLDIQKKVYACRTLIGDDFFKREYLSFFMRLARAEELSQILTAFADRTVKFEEMSAEKSMPLVKMQLQVRTLQKKDAEEHKEDTFSVACSPHVDKKPDADLKDLEIARLRSALAFVKSQGYVKAIDLL